VSKGVNNKKCVRNLLNKSSHEGVLLILKWESFEAEGKRKLPIRNSIVLQDKSIDRSCNMYSVCE